MDEHKKVIKLSKGLSILNLILGVVFVIFISLFSYKSYLNYKTSKVTDAYAKKTYEIYRDKIFPVIENITLQDLTERKKEYDRSYKYYEHQRFEDYLYTYYNLDSAMGGFSDVYASGMEYFSGKIHKSLFEKFLSPWIAVNPTANIPSTVETTISYFEASQTPKVEIQQYYDSYNYDFKVNDKFIQDLITEPITLNKEIIKLFDNEINSGKSYTHAIYKIGKYLLKNKINDIWF